MTDQKTLIDNSNQGSEYEEIRMENRPAAGRMNPRLVWTNPDRFFGVDDYYDLLLEQQEGM